MNTANIVRARVCGVGPTRTGYVIFARCVLHLDFGLAGRRLNSHARAKLHNNFFNVAYNLRYNVIVTINSEEIHVLLYS